MYKYTWQVNGTNPNEASSLQAAVLEARAYARKNQQTEITIYRDRNVCRKDTLSPVTGKWQASKFI